MNIQTHAKFEDSRKGVLKFFIMSLLCLAILLSYGRIPVFAEEATTFNINLSNADIVGNVTLNSKEYPLYRISVNGSTYSSICMLKETGTISVNGAEKKFPSTAFTADSKGGIGSLPVSISANDTNFTAATTYYTDKTADIKITAEITTNNDDNQLLFRLRYGTGKNAKNCAFLLVSWSPVPTVDKTGLQAKLGAAPSPDSDSSYYHTGDR